LSGAAISVATTRSACGASGTRRSIRSALARSDIENFKLEALIAGDSNGNCASGATVPTAGSIPAFSAVTSLSARAHVAPPRVFKTYPRARSASFSVTTVTTLSPVAAALAIGPSI
jgi:hypothetical protein